MSSGVDGLLWFDGRLLTQQGSAGWGWHGAPDAALPTLEKIGAIGCENPDIRSATFYGRGTWFAGGIVHDLSCGGGGGMLSYWWREGSLAGAPIAGQRVEGGALRRIAIAPSSESHVSGVGDALRWSHRCVPKA